MRCRSLIFGFVCASFVLASVAPAFADDDDWRRHGMDERRQHEWREHQRREHEWREHEWRERQGFYAPPPFYATPPVVAQPGYGFYGPPPAFYNNPRY